MKDTDYSLHVDLPGDDKPLAMVERLLYSHPKEILTSGMSVAEKREILSSWASDARAVPDAPALRTLDNGAVVGVHEILDALQALNKSKSSQTSQVKTQELTRRHAFLKLLTEPSRKGQSDDDDDDDPPPCPAVVSPLPPLPPFGMHAELEAA